MDTPEIQRIMNIITSKVKKMVADAGCPDELGIDKDLYIELLNTLPLHTRMSRNDGTENIIFPLLSNCKVYPLNA